MKIFKKPIFVSISPDAQTDDIWLALKLFFQPWKWKEGKEIGVFEKSLEEYLNCDVRGQTPNARAVTLESGRTALYAILQAMEIGGGDEVLIQAFTCTAAVNPILWVGANPVYVDVAEGEFNMSVEDLENKITPKSKAIIIQHTFGYPAEIDQILEIAKKHDLRVIEDCAHSLGATYKKQQTGTFGDAAIFSFGRSKVISAVFGGAAVAKESELAQKIRAIRDKWQYPSYRWILQQLFHPPYIAVAKFLYNFLSIGKVMIIVAKKMGLISVMVYSVEKSGGKPPFGPAKMPNALAVIGLNQIKKIEAFNRHRKELAGFYKKALQGTQGIGLLESLSNSKSIFLNFPIQVSNFGIRWKLIGEARARGIYLESWPAKDKKVIGPDNVCLEKLGYTEGSCPNAERIVATSINLPTHPNMSLDDARRVVDFLERFFKSNGQ